MPYIQPTESPMILLIVFIVAILIIALAIFLFLYYIFGGKIKYLKEGEFIVTPKEYSTQLPQEKIAVVYSKNVTEGIQTVVQKCGNLDFIKPGETILVKPNVNSDIPSPGTTHPKAVSEIVRLCFASGAKKVIVADRSNEKWNTIQAMKKNGIFEAALKAGAEITGLENIAWIRIKPKKAKRWRRGFRISKILFEVDHVINLAGLNTHSILDHSLALKNTVGLIYPVDRYFFHARPHVAQAIAEINLALRYSLNILVGNKSFISGGPFSGKIANPEVYVASKDIVVCDVVGVMLLNKFRANLKYPDPYLNPQTKAAFELGLNYFSKKEIEQEITRLLSNNLL